MRDAADAIRDGYMVTAVGFACLLAALDASAGLILAPATLATGFWVVDHFEHTSKKSANEVTAGD